VKLKAEKDGRMFPTTNSSQTIIDCLLGQARAAGVKLILNRGVEAATKRPKAGLSCGCLTVKRSNAIACC